LRRNTEEKKKKKQGGKKGRKRRTRSTENFQGSTWQNYYTGGERRNTSRSIGKGWKKIGGDGKGIHLLK